MRQIGNEANRRKEGLTLSRANLFTNKQITIPPITNSPIPQFPENPNQ